MNFLKRTWPLTASLLIVFVITNILYFSNNKNAALLFANFGSLAVVISNVIYITAIESKSRWPNKHWTERLWKLFTFQK